MTDTMTSQNIDLSSWDTLYKYLSTHLILTHKLHQSTLNISQRFARFTNISLCDSPLQSLLLSKGMTN